MCLNIASFGQALVKRVPDQIARVCGGELTESQPITGIAFCCARRARAAVIAPANRSTKSRRLTPNPSIWLRAAIIAQQRPYPITLDERQLATPSGPLVWVPSVRFYPLASNRTTGSGSVGAAFQLGGKFGVGRCGGIEKTSLISLISEERCTRPHMRWKIGSRVRWPKRAVALRLANV